MKYSQKKIDQLIEKIYSGEANEYSIPEDLYNATAEYLLNGVYKVFGGKMTDFNGKDYELLNELRENVYMFSAAKSFQELRDIGSLMFDEKGNRLNINEFSKLANEKFDVWNDDWGRTEYNTAVASAQTSVKWQEIENNKDLLPKLCYHTIGDACDICAPLDGMTADVDDSIWNTLTPPNHFNCLCVITQEKEDKESTSKKEKEETFSKVDKVMDDTFKFNSGKDRVVFSEDHPYFHVPKKDAAFAKENFGLPIPEPEAPKENVSTTREDAIKKLEDFLKNCTKEEKSEVWEYTTDSYQDINRHLRKGKDLPEKFVKNKTIEHISSFLDKAPRFKGTTYRGLWFGYEEDFEEFSKKSEVGNIFSDEGFMSTTFRREKAVNFSNGTNYSVVCVVEGKSGVPIELLSDMYTEQEVLFNKGTSFSVIKKIKLEDGTLEVHLKEEL